MDIKITPSILSGKIQAPASKSHAHRILIAAFLSGKKIKIKNIGTSVDVLVTLSAIEKMGANVVKKGNTVIISKGQLPTEKEVIDCKESGSSLRFLVPVACAKNLNAEFTGAKRLMERPMHDLINCLKDNGANFNGLTVSGNLKCGKYYIDGGVSSQYITGLLFALSALNGESQIIIDGQLVSKPYVDITIKVLKEFGVKIVENKDGFTVIGGYNVKKRTFNVEGDWSGAAFYLSAGAIGKSITIKGLNPNSTQGDKEILNVLKSFGAKVKINKNSITVKKDKLNGINLDVENIPDLAQIISVVASFCNGNTTLVNVDRLKLKESDRIQAIINTLSSVGIKATYKDNSLTIVGGRIGSGIISGGKDHRTVMSSAIISTFGNSESTILGAEAHTKSYPDFFKDFIKLGGKISGEI